MREVLDKEVTTDAIIEAWEKTYSKIADVFISVKPKCNKKYKIQLVDG